MQTKEYVSLWCHTMAVANNAAYVTKVIHYPSILNRSAPNTGQFITTPPRYPAH